ncbi:SHQ1-domain-containing [Pyrrhoderma noxium]|uniref:SHQ1-domain-containing n=1 Tax=Pyrrhoderma noxium TaxID=2282107 RepID=A0A286UXJ1_9AGAM|nr:SHQ1-domain-containing [Pyrrhoderma noxium]
MITPRFKCSQTENAVITRIYCPAVRASDIELHVEGTLFSVHINPYYLRLVLPGSVIEDDDSSAVYDADQGYLTVTLTKSTPGEDFKDLDVLARLLAPPKLDTSNTPTQPLIEVMDSQDDNDDAVSLEELSQDQRDLLEASENDWHIQQQAPESSSVSVSTERRYGFLDAYTGYFSHVTHTANEINELGEDIEKLSLSERREKRLKREEEKWDEDYYIADYHDDENIQELILYQFPPDSPFSVELSDHFAFSEDENMAMLLLPRKEYLATPQQIYNLYLTLLTILFSSAYDSRTTQNDPTPESAWTICSLTPAFTALDPPPYSTPAPNSQSFTTPEIQSAFTPSLRRSLAYPLYRSFALAERCIQDVAVALSNGRRAILRELLKIRDVLDHHEVYYIYSRIWIDDFCRWVATDASESILHELGDLLKQTQFAKDNIGWDLLALEALGIDSEREPDSDDESEDGGPIPEDSDSDSCSSSSSSSSSSSISSPSSSSSSGSSGEAPNINTIQ